MNGSSHRSNIVNNNNNEHNANNEHNNKRIILALSFCLGVVSKLSL